MRGTPSQAEITSQPPVKSDGKNELGCDAQRSSCLSRMHIQGLLDHGNRAFGALVDASLTLSAPVGKLDDRLVVLLVDPLWANINTSKTRATLVVIDLRGHFCSP
jgi:hypothetical protein